MADERQYFLTEAGRREFGIDTNEDFAEAARSNTVEIVPRKVLSLFGQNAVLNAFGFNRYSRITRAMVQGYARPFRNDFAYQLSGSKYGFYVGTKWNTPEQLQGAINHSAELAETINNPDLRTRDGQWLVRAPEIYGGIFVPRSESQETAYIVQIGEWTRGDRTLAKPQGPMSRHGGLGEEVWHAARVRLAEMGREEGDFERILPYRENDHLVAIPGLNRDAFGVYGTVWVIDQYSAPEEDI